MKIAEIAELARFIGCFRRLDRVARVQDMVLRLSLREFEAHGSNMLARELKDSLILTESGACDIYLSMLKGDSHAFIPPHEILGSRHYSAPFDIALGKLARSQIISSRLHGGDRILRLELERVSSYKRECVIMQCEFSGKHTNVILLTPPESSSTSTAPEGASESVTEGIVIEALRHISPALSCRPVRVGAPLLPMPPNPRIQPPSTQESSVESTQPKPLESSIPQSLEADSARDSASPESRLLDFARSLQQRYLTQQDREKERLRATLKTHYRRALSKLESLLDSLPSSSELESRSAALYHQANALLSIIYTLKPYQRSAVVENESIEIPPARSPQDAINGLFKEAKKLAKKAQNIHKEIENLTSKITFTKHQLDFIQHTQSLETLQLLIPPKSQKLHKSKSTPPNSRDSKNTKEPAKAQVLFIQGFKLSIGRNERENLLLLQAARADDMWLHVRDVPSSHMIIHCGKHKVPESILHKAAEILLGSSGLHKGDYCVDYTRRKFVKITHGAQVLYTKAQSLHV